MKQFNIEIISKKSEKIDGLLSYWGKITINDFSKRFVMPLNSWTVEQYKQQWKEGIERLKTHNNSCLVTTIQNLDKNPLIEMWTLHKEGNVIFIHHQLVNRMIAKELNLPISINEFNSKTCYQFINERISNSENKGINEDGEEISEWRTGLNEVLQLVL
jgi:hypothetical protein